MEDLPGGDLSFEEEPLPGVSTAAAWYLERGGPWRVRFIYGAHYTVDLFAVSNPALQAFLELTSTAGWAHSFCALCHSAGFVCDAFVLCVLMTVARQPSSQQTSLAWRLRGQG